MTFTKIFDTTIEHLWIVGIGVAILGIWLAKK